jgi:hypothetical protein
VPPKSKTVRATGTPALAAPALPDKKPSKPKE